MKRLTFARRLSILAPVMIAAWAADQVTKHLAIRYLKGAPMRSYLGDVFRFDYAENNGAFLSLGSNLPPAVRFWILTVGVGALLLYLLVYTFRVQQATMRLLTGFALVCVGGLSNWFDRVLFEGYVIDFMNVGIGSLRSGIFNVADLLIEAGAILIIWDVWRTRERRPSR